MVEITVERLEKLIEAEIRVDILRKYSEEEEYVTSKNLRRILGMEVLKHGAE